MIIEEGTHLLESMVSVTMALGLLVGAVRVIPKNGIKLQILDDLGSKTRPARSGHVVVPDGNSVSIGLFSDNGILQTIINVHDITTRNPDTSRAEVTGIKKNILATLTRRRPLANLNDKNLVVKYLPSKKNRQQSG